MTADHRTRTGWLTVFVAAVIGLLLAEGAVRLFDVDWRLLHRMLYYQEVDVASHQPDPDPEILYRPRPGTVRYEDRTVFINSLGFRSPERPSKKPLGVFRILVVGASNVYGPRVDNDETLPARLEAELRKRGAERLEVWGMGVPGSVGIQWAHYLDEKERQIEPDLVILALSNAGVPPFLLGSPVKPYFDRHVEMWKTLFPEDELTFPGFLSYDDRLALFRHVRFYRLGYLAVLATRETLPNWRTGADTEPLNIERIRAYLTHREHRPPVCVFLCPAPECHPLSIGAYTDEIAVPILDLDASGMPAGFDDVHPYAPTYRWYGEAIADWLVGQSLVPTAPDAE